MQRLTYKLLTTISIICLGSLQFGYHMAELNSPQSVISCEASKPGQIPYDESWFGRHGFVQCIALTVKQVGLVTSIFSIGGLIGSFYVGGVADKIGRKKASLLYCTILVFGSTLNAFSNSYLALLGGRFIAGLGSGAALVITPVFITEIAPPTMRGLLGSMNQVFTNIGIAVTQFLALKWCDNNNWRLLLLTAAFIAAVDFLLILFCVDESPTWLQMKGHDVDASRILHRLRGGGFSEARSEVRSWKANSNQSNNDVENDGLLEESEGSRERPSNDNSTISLEIYLKSSEFNYSKIVSTGILMFQQFCGINSIIFYGVSVLVAIFPRLAIMINCAISVLNIVVTLGAAPFTDKLGRKPLLLTSVSAMGVLTVLMAVGIIFLSASFSIIGMFAYVSFFAIGLGPIPFLLVSEVTQPRARASAQSWGTTMNWLATFIVGYLFPVLKSTWIGGGVYFIFTIMCFLAFMFIKRWIPETKGATSYEEVRGLRILPQ